MLFFISMQVLGFGIVGKTREARTHGLERSCAEAVRPPAMGIGVPPCFRGMLLSGTKVGFPRDYQILLWHWESKNIKKAVLFAPLLFMLKSALI